MRAGGPTESEAQSQADLPNSWGVSGVWSGPAPCHCASQ